MNNKHVRFQRLDSSEGSTTHFTLETVELSDVGFISVNGQPPLRDACMRADFTHIFRFPNVDLIHVGPLIVPTGERFIAIGALNESVSPVLDVVHDREMFVVMGDVNILLTMGAM